MPEPPLGPQGSPRGREDDEAASPWPVPFRGRLALPAAHKEGGGQALWLPPPWAPLPPLGLTPFVGVSLVGLGCSFSVYTCRMDAPALTFGQLSLTALAAD